MAVKLVEDNNITGMQRQYRDGFRAGLMYRAKREFWIGTTIGAISAWIGLWIGGFLK